MRAALMPPCSRLGAVFRRHRTYGALPLATTIDPPEFTQDAIIFLAPISCYDEVLEEDPTVNRLVRAISEMPSLYFRSTPWPPSRPCPPQRSLIQRAGRLDEAVANDMREPTSEEHRPDLVPQQVRRDEGEASRRPVLTTRRLLQGPRRRFRGLRELYVDLSAMLPCAY